MKIIIPLLLLISHSVISSEVNLTQISTSYEQNSDPLEHHLIFTFESRPKSKQDFENIIDHLFKMRGYIKNKIKRDNRNYTKIIISYPNRVQSININGEFFIIKNWNKLMKNKNNWEQLISNYNWNWNH